MALTEFDLINKYFQQVGPRRDDVRLGVGDDCALLAVPAGRDLAVSIDTLVAGRHFLPDVDPESLGHKALAVNLSDLAAMGADPAWVTLALTLPETNNDWLAAFAHGFARLANEAGVTLVGGDTTSGPLSVTVQVHGFVDENSVLRRDGAAPGDLIFVSGSIGGAALALRLRQGGGGGGDGMDELCRCLDWPEPRLELSRCIRETASSCIDISDGLGADLGHICTRSGVGALIYADLLPLPDPVAGYVQAAGDWRLPLAGGDDYELCFTVAPESRDELMRAVADVFPEVHEVGVIVEGSGVRCSLPDGSEVEVSRAGFDHFL